MRTLAIKAAFLGAFAVLSACGNDTSTAQPTKVIGDLVKGLAAGRSGPPEPIPDLLVATALGASSEPVVLVDLKERNTQALLLRIETNGPYETFATSARQSITMRNGIMTATRGLGGDLMSSESDALIGLLRARRAGTVSYVMRFLNGEDQTRSLRYTCSLRDTGTERVARGQINVVGKRMTATCTGNAKSFELHFVISQSGFVLKADQWLGDYLGQVSAQALRR